MKNEREAQIESNIETKIVSLTYEEFKRLMEEIENNVYELTESNNQDAEGPSSEVGQLMRLRMEVAQKLNRRKKLQRTLTLHPNSATSARSN